MLALALSVAVALSPVGAAQQKPTAKERSLPQRGVLIVGKSLAGIKPGDTPARVQALWGSKHEPCTLPGWRICRGPGWLFWHPSDLYEDRIVGAGVRFKKNKVIAVFTLGALPGWRSQNGIKIGDPISAVWAVHARMGVSKCIGFEAFSVRRKNVVTWYYSYAGLVYGFALTRPGITPC